VVDRAVFDRRRVLSFQASSTPYASWWPRLASVPADAAPNVCKFEGRSDRLEALNAPLTHGSEEMRRANIRWSGRWGRRGQAFVNLGAAAGVHALPMRRRPGPTREAPTVVTAAGDTTAD
jgi:hypothetical protein